MQSSINRRNFIKFLGITPLYLKGINDLFKANNRIIDFFENDEQICLRKFKAYMEAKISRQSIGDEIGFIGKSFLGTEYVANTLEINDEEELVINLRGFDCVTFVENCLSFARCIKKNKTSFNDFKKEIETIRYRDGKIDGYSSRLNYFCDWIYNNGQKGIIKDISQEIGGVIYNKSINFMSRHTKSYKQLTDKSELSEIIACEEAINSRDYYYIPKKSIEKTYEYLQSGDIIATTTTIEGLDVTHTGYVYKSDDEIPHFLHASSKYGEVIISKNSLADYISEDSKKTGIMVARPLEI